MKEISISSDSSQWKFMTSHIAWDLYVWISVHSVGFPTPNVKRYDGMTGPQKHTIQTAFTSGGMTGCLGYLYVLNGFLSFLYVFLLNYWPYRHKPTRIIQTRLWGSSPESSQFRYFGCQGFKQKNVPSCIFCCNQF